MQLIAPATLALALLTTGAFAQVQKVEDMTTWTHTTTSGDTWKDDQTQTGSKAAKVDVLVSGKNMQFSRSSALILDPGTYVFTARIMKATSTTGIAAINSRVRGSGFDSMSTLTTAQQPVDKWIHTTSVAFTLKKKGPVIITVGNTDTSVTKQNYVFDQILIGKVPEGDCLYYHSMTHRTWRAVHGSPYYTHNSANKDSAFGEVSSMNYVSWLEFRSWQTVNKVRTGNRYVLQPGTYTWNIRMQRNSTSTASKAVFTKQISIGGAAFKNVQTWNAANVPANTWVLTPNVSFVITQKDTIVDFRIWDKISVWKRSYLFDAFILRHGAVDSVGAGCKTSAGTAALTGDPGRVGCSMTLRASNVSGSAIFAAGQMLGTPVSLGNGCNLYVTPTFVVPVTATGSNASLKIDLPNLTVLKGLTLGAQAATNGLNGAIATTNAAKVVIG